MMLPLPPKSVRQIGMKHWRRLEASDGVHYVVATVSNLALANEKEWMVPAHFFLDYPEMFDSYCAD